MKIVKKEYIDIQSGYWDLEIEDNHNFFANGVLVHNSNFGFICDGDNVQAFKRTSVLKDVELSKFYNADIMMEKYKDNVLKLTDYLQNIYNVSEVQIYGEHFGGVFNSETEKGYTKIRKEVQYIPFTDFMVFDIAVTFKELNESKRVFLDWDFVKELSEKFGFKTVPELFRGTFEECLNYPNEYLTKIPEMYGLENFEGNITEGNVIKPVKPLFFPNGERVILKNKNDKFKEKGKIKKPKGAKNLNLTDEERKWVEEISRYFEINRIQNLLSKGEVQLDWKQFGKISGLFFQDALEDFKKDNPKFEELDKGSKKLIQRYAQKQAQEFVRDFMKRHI